MTNFKIEFSFNELDYTADVAKIPLVNGLPVQLHVHNIKPEIANVSNPYFFIHQPQNEQFTFALYDQDTKLPGKMLNAIKEYCTEHDISLTT